ncbi:MAG: MFS transporter [Chloroflexi bacterium]|nr:MAG: MFS transporter [Chloroflexota bacterium]
MFGRILRDAFPLRRGEWGLGLFLYALLTLMVASDWIGKLGADSLFVKRWGVNYVPVMYIVTPIAMLAVSAMIFFFVDRVRRRTLLLWYVAGVTVLSVAIQGGVWVQGQFDYGWIVQPISYVFAHGVKETIYILFWVYAGNLYDAGQSKRLFPFFAGSVLVGKILGGAIGAGIAPLIHAENFIGAQAVGFMVCFVALVVYRGLPEGHGSRLAEERSKGIAASLKDSVDGYRAVASDRMLRTFGVGVFFWYFLMQFGNFLYLVGLDQSTAGTGTGSEDLFSQLYASVYTSSSLVALFIQSVFTGALLRRFGIARVLFVLPLWFLGSYAAATFNFNIITAIAIQLSERIVIPAIHRPASELVYSQVVAAIRPRARAFLSGGVNAFGNFAAAIALLAGLQLHDNQLLLAVATGLSGVYLYNAAHMMRLFGRRILENLSSIEPDVRFSAAEILATEHGAVPEDLLRSLDGTIPADVEHGVRVALTRRGLLAVAADATE